MIFFVRDYIILLICFAIPQHGSQNKLTKFYNHGHKISKRFTQADYSNTKGYDSYLDERGRGKTKKLTNIAIYRLFDRMCVSLGVVGRSEPVIDFNLFGFVIR